MLQQPQCLSSGLRWRAVPAFQPLNAAAIGASVGGSMLLIVAVLAVLYAWHRLRGPLPLVMWLTCSRKTSGIDGVREALALMPRGLVCRLQVTPWPQEASKSCVVLME